MCDRCLDDMAMCGCFVSVRGYIYVCVWSECLGEWW